MKIYDLVYKLLVNEPELRNSDKKLMWQVWKTMGFVVAGEIEYVPYNYFMSKKIPHFESIRRSRQKVQELNPELGPVKSVAKARKEKEKQKGTWIFREDTQTYKKI